MKVADVRELLERMETAPVPEPDPAFVARLEVQLREMDQTLEAEERRPAPAARHRRRARVLVAAGPIAALTAAAAAAAVTLLPAEHHPRRVDTADPGVTTPVPEVPTTEQPSPGSTPTSVVVPPPWLPPTGSPAASPPTTTAKRHVIPGPPVTSPAEHPTPTTAPPVTAPTPPTTEVAPTTTVPPSPETLTLNCAAGMSGTSAVVGCHWSPSTSANFKWYRLWRESQGSPPALVYQSDNQTTTGYYDYTVQAGTGYGYKVDVTDAAGNVIGRSDVATVNCC
jgi:hypothetical protein